MISLNDCKNILKKEKRNYSDEEVKMIRSFLYTVAEIEEENRK